MEDINHINKKEPIDITEQSLKRTLDILDTISTLYHNKDSYSENEKRIILHKLHKQSKLL
jgi:hypothetical protein